MTEPQEKKPTDYTGVIIGAILLPVVLLFIHLGKEDMGRSLSVVLAATLLAIRIRWDLRRHFWFWGAIVLVFAVHIPLILFIQWPHGWIPAVAMLPIAVAECLVILGIFRLIEKITKGTRNRSLAG
ncbi:MAG TPA: hypothetical protein VF018_13340 [Acidobacteriaceae bacterium]